MHLGKGLNVMPMLSLSQVQEIVIDYTNCKPDSDSHQDLYSTCAEYVEEKNYTADSEVCQCTVNFTLTEDFGVSYG